MAAFLVDPISRSIADVEDRLDPGKPVLESLRTIIGATQLSIVGIANNGLALVVDNFGMLKPGVGYWRFSDGSSRIAGKAVVFAIDRETGALAPVVDEALQTLVDNVVFADDDVHLLRVEELILTEPGEAPMIARVPVFSDEPEPEVLAAHDAGQRTVQPAQDAVQAPGEDTGWVVQASRQGGVRATRYRLDEAGGLETVEVRSAADLHALRELMPPGLKRVDPSDDEPADVLELWVA